MRVFYLIVILLEVSICYADSETNFIYAGDNDFHEPSGYTQDFQIFSATFFCGNGACEFWEDNMNCPQDCGVITNEGSMAQVRKYYDVIVNVLKQTYAPGEKVDSELTIELIPEIDVPQDGILKYYLISPIGEKTSISQQYFKEGDTKKKIELSLPTDAIIGMWQFQVEWEVSGIPVITNYSSFEVVEKSWYKRFYDNHSIAIWIISIIAICLIAFTLYEYKLEEKDEHGKP